MNKAKILSAAIAAAMLSSVACVTAFADPTVFTDGSQVADHTVGLIGSFNGWAADEPMTDADGDGVWEGTITIDSVTADMISEWVKEEEPTGKTGVQFKVRLDGSWDDSWGEYEEGYVRTNNSQTNCFVECAEGDALTINVKFDTTKPADAAVAAGETTTDEDDKADWYLFWPVTYEVVESAGSGDADTQTDAGDGEDAGTGDDAAEDTDTTDTTGTADDTEEPATTPAEETTEAAETPATGDATSAAALVGVVLASLGVAAVMAKKSRD